MRRGVNRAWATCPIFERPKFVRIQAQFWESDREIGSGERFLSLSCVRGSDDGWGQRLEQEIQERFSVVLFRSCACENHVQRVLQPTRRHCHAFVKHYWSDCLVRLISNTLSWVWHNSNYDDFDRTRLTVRLFQIVVTLSFEDCTQHCR